MRDVMIDIETLSTAHNAVVLSIGACTFTPDGIGETLHIVVNREVQQQQYGRHVCTDTVCWWMAQSQEARDAVFGKAVLLVPPGIACAKLADLIGEDARVWAHSPQFDLIILQSLFRDTGHDFRFPHFSSWRDTRTLYELASVDVRPFRLRSGTAHNALDDAVAQARAAIVALKKLGVYDAERTGAPTSGGDEVVRTVEPASA